MRAYATNSVGTGYGMAMAFTTSTTAPTVWTSHIREIAATSAKSGGHVISSGGAVITARGVCWSTTPNPTVSSNHTVDGAGDGDFTSTVTELVPNTDYFLRAYATNATGTGYGGAVSFKTSAVPPAVQTQYVDDLQQNSALIGATVTSDGGAAVISRGICWSTDENPTITDHVVESGSGLGSFATAIVDLLPRTSYFVRAYATNSVGTGYGAQLSFTTPLRFPVGLSAVNGHYYRGNLSESGTDPELVLMVADSNGGLANELVQVSLVAGDGIVTSNQLLTDADGKAVLTFTFGSSAGYADVRAIWQSQDTFDLFLRANLIAPGVNFQGQYVRMGDNAGVVKGYNPNPIADTPDPNFFLNYLDYEAVSGLVVIIEDTNHNSTSQDFEPVYGVILNTIYSGTAASGWGIGSPVQDLLNEYGAVTPTFDPSPPAAYSYVWPAFGLTAYTTTEATESARTVFEVHLVEAQPLTATLPKLNRQR